MVLKYRFEYEYRDGDIIWNRIRESDNATIEQVLKKYNELMADTNFQNGYLLKVTFDDEECSYSEIKSVLENSTCEKENIKISKLSTFKAGEQDAWYLYGRVVTQELFKMIVYKLILDKLMGDNDTEI